MDIDNLKPIIFYSSIISLVLSTIAYNRCLEAESNLDNRYYFEADVKNIGEDLSEHIVALDSIVYQGQQSLQRIKNDVRLSRHLGILNEYYIFPLSELESDIDEYYEGRREVYWELNSLWKYRNNIPLHRKRTINEVNERYYIYYGKETY